MNQHPFFLGFLGMATTSVVLAAAPAMKPAAPAKPPPAAASVTATVTGQLDGKLLAAGDNRVMILNTDGTIAWQHPAGLTHDVWMLPNGNVLYADGNTVTEITPAQKVVFQYKSAEQHGGGTYACQRLDNGNTLVGENSTGKVLEVDAKDFGIYENELFGPIVLIIKTKNTHQSLELAREMAVKHGSITCAAYTTNDELAKEIEEEMETSFTPVSFNLTGGIFVNQHATFSDFHVTGGNPAGNASFTNPDYVNRRFVWVGHRKN